MNDVAITADAIETEDGRWFAQLIHKRRDASGLDERLEALPRGVRPTRDEALAYAVAEIQRRREG